MGDLLKNMVFISTRPEGPADELALLFASEGAVLLEMPLIKIQPVKLADNENETFRNLSRFQWVVFTSPNGVRCFFDHLEKTAGNRNLPQTLKFAVIGKKTETVLANFGVSPDFVNPGSTGEDFAKAFIPEIQKAKKKPAVLLAFGKLARNVIQEELNDFAVVTRINLYDTQTAEKADETIRQQILANQYEMLLFTSPSGISGFQKLFPENLNEKIRVACIGETTSGAAAKYNIKPLVVAENSSAKGLFESIIQYYKSQKTE